MPKILIVDDSQAMRLHVQNLLTPVFSGCEFITADGFATGLKQVLANPDLCFILTDYTLAMMPGSETGLTLLTSLSLLGVTHARNLKGAIMTDGGKLPAVEEKLAKENQITVLAKPTHQTEAQFIAALRTLIGPCLP